MRIRIMAIMPTNRKEKETTMNFKENDRVTLKVKFRRNGKEPRIFVIKFIIHSNVGVKYWLSPEDGRPISETEDYLLMSVSETDQVMEKIGGEWITEDCQFPYRCDCACQCYTNGMRDVR